MSDARWKLNLHPELRCVRDLAAYINEVIDEYEEKSWNEVWPEAGRKACDRLREGLIAVMRRACDELGKPVPREIDLILGPRMPTAEDWAKASPSEFAAADALLEQKLGRKII